MGLLADVILDGVNLAEVEVKTGMRGVLRFLIGAVLVASGLAVLMFGSGLLLWGLYVHLALWTTPAWARILVGLFAWLAALAVLRASRRTAATRPARR